MPEGDLATALHGDFQKEISRRDNQIRSLGFEIDNLIKQRDEASNELRKTNLDLMKSKDELSAIDATLTAKKKDFEDSKIPVNKALLDKESALNTREGVLHEKEKAIKEEDALLDEKRKSVDHLKVELADNLKKMSASVTEYINEVVEAIEGH